MVKGERPTMHLLDIYDNFRRRAVLHNSKREEIGEIVRHIYPGGDAAIIFSDLTDRTADAVIRSQIEACSQRGCVLEWLVYSHDKPADLGQRLQRQGFVAEDGETVMMLDLQQAMVPEPADTGFEVRRAGTPSALQAAANIRAETWGGDARAIAERLAQRLADTPDALSVYVAYAGDQPAGTAQITFYPELQFASLGSAATLPAYRRRGLYTQLLQVRLREAQERQVRFIDTEASSMSRPALEKVGFQPISSVTVYSWEPGQGSF